MKKLHRLYSFREKKRKRIVPPLNLKFNPDLSDLFDLSAYLKMFFAITNLCISFVPSPMAHKRWSRYIRSTA